VTNSMFEINVSSFWNWMGWFGHSTSSTSCLSLGVMQDIHIHSSGLCFGNIKKCNDQKANLNG
jgi:hypothetical protein